MGIKNVFRKAKDVYLAPASEALPSKKEKSIALTGDDELLLPMPGTSAWMQEIDEADIMLEHLFEIAEGNDWFDIDEEEHNLQLMTIRSSVNTYVSRPLGDEQTALEHIAQGLNSTLR